MCTILLGGEGKQGQKIMFLSICALQNVGIVGNILFPVGIHIAMKPHQLVIKKYGINNVIYTKDMLISL